MDRCSVATNCDTSSLGRGAVRAGRAGKIVAAGVQSSGKSPSKSFNSSSSKVNPTIHVWPNNRSEYWLLLPYRGAY
jgi:hypothetical protein